MNQIVKLSHNVEIRIDNLAAAILGSWEPQAKMCSPRVQTNEICHRLDWTGLQVGLWSIVSIVQGF